MQTTSGDNLTTTDWSMMLAFGTKWPSNSNLQLPLEQAQEDLLCRRARAACSGKVFGLPNGIVSKRGSICTSAFLSKVYKLLGVIQLLSTAHHSPTDAQSERSNCTLKDMSMHFVSSNKNDWDIRSPCCEFAVNNAQNASTGITRYLQNHGEHPRSPDSAGIMFRLPAAKLFDERVKEALQRARD